MLIIVVFVFTFVVFWSEAKQVENRKAQTWGFGGNQKSPLELCRDSEWLQVTPSSWYLKSVCSARDSVIVCLWTSWLCGEYVGPRTLFSCVRRSYCFSTSSLKPRGMAFIRPQRKGKHLLILSCVTPGMSQVRALGTRSKVPVQFPGNQTCRTGLTRHGSFWVKMTVSRVRQLHSWNCDCDVMESSAEHS